MSRRILRRLQGRRRIRCAFYGWVEEGKEVGKLTCLSFESRASTARPKGPKSLAKNSSVKEQSLRGNLFSYKTSSDQKKKTTTFWKQYQATYSFKHQLNSQ